jgi:chromosome segregation ATPase
VEVVLEAESSTLNEFIEKQRERVILLKALDSLEEELREGKIENDQYERMAAEHNRGLGSLSDSLRQLGRGLAEEPELAEPLREIRQAEGELARITSDLKNLEVRLRARRVTRSDFERRRGDRIRRRGLAIKRIEKALESLGG